MTLQKSGGSWLGKYRGIVTSQPDKQGRISVSVPDVFPDGTTKPAMPSVPYAGEGVGFFAIPKENSKVWVEFEQGDPDAPIWSGCFWDEEEDDGPDSSPNADKKVIRTKHCTITLSDVQGDTGITLQVGDSIKLIIKDDSIELTTGQGSLVLSGAQLSVNNGALEVS